MKWKRDAIYLEEHCHMAEENNPSNDKKQAGS
jgi:hypothetical protein